MKNNYSLFGFLLLMLGLLLGTPAFSQIVANPDYGTTINSSGTSVVIQDLLNNDSLNGFPVTLSQVTISQVSGTSNYFSINPNSGALVFNGPAPLGGYYLGYQICENSNLSNCAQADIFVNVVPNQIRTVRDYANVANSSTPVVVIQDILANDTMNNLPITLNQVAISQVSSTNNYLSISNGSVIFSNGPAPSGTYTINYAVCEIARPNNCASGSAVVTIGCAVTTPTPTVTQPSCFSGLGSIQLSGMPAVGTWTLYSNDNVIRTSSGVVTTLTGLSPGEYTYTVKNSGGCYSAPFTVKIGYLGTSITGNYVDFNADGVANVGDVIEYTISVNNLSTCDLSNVAVTINANVVGDPISLIAGSANSTTFTATYPLTQGDINSGFVYKSITATGTGAGSVGVVSATSATTTPLNVSDGIKLVAFLDTNSNGVKDASENIFTFGEYHYEINNSGTVTNIASNSDYYLYESNPATTYDLSYTVNSAIAAQYTVATPNYNNITVADNSGITTYYFAVTQIPFKDLEIVIYPYGISPRPGFTYYNNVTYRNAGNITIPSGTITFTKDNLLSILSVSQAGIAANATGFTFNFTNLAPNETRNFIVNMQVPTIPTVQLGNLLTNSATISNPDTDINLANNQSSYSQIIVGSYDPNDKSESHGGKVLFSGFTANDYLTYTIRFENTGTAEAINIRVNDVLDSQLDETSVRMVKSSHPYILERVGSSLTWKFNGVLLPPSVEGTNIGHGYIVFQVKPKPGYALGDVIPNTADIFFDFNPAIVTNTWTTEFVPFLGTHAFDNGSLQYYPNPVKNIFHLSNDAKIDSIEVTSVLGQVFLRKEIHTTAADIDLSVLSKGVYFISLKSENQTKTVKIIKE